jgi:hypothetical protein
MIEELRNKLEIIYGKDLNNSFDQKEITNRLYYKIIREEKK